MTESQRPSFRQTLMQRTARAVSDFLAMASAPKPSENQGLGDLVKGDVLASKKRGRKKQRHMEMPSRRPWNVTSNGNVWRHPGVRISDKTIPHMVKGLDGVMVQHYSVLKAKHGSKLYPVMMQRAVSVEVFRDEMNTRRRMAAGRFVGPFNFPRA